MSRDLLAGNEETKMVELQRLPASADVGAINRVLEVDGAVIIEDALPAATTALVRDELLDLLKEAPSGDDLSLIHI